MKEILWNENINKGKHMIANYLDLPEDEKKEIINDYLQYKLPPELKERYKARREAALDLQNKNYQGPEALEALKESASLRNLASGLHKASSQFGTNPADGKVSSSYNIDDFMDSQNRMDAAEFDYSTKQYQNGLLQEEKADQNLRDFDAYNLGLEEKQRNYETQAKNNTWLQEQQAQQRKGWEREDETYDSSKTTAAQKSDPASPISKSYQSLAQKLTNSNQDFSKLSADQLEAVIPSLSKAYEIDQNAQNRRDAKAERLENKEALKYQKAKDKEEKLAEKNLQLNVPGVGQAITADDAKQLKEATQSKKSFDAKLNELIELRSKHGGEVMNREAVARGKQLSKDLLLDYKNMAKLGVLSKSDEDIINAIIPDDPLAFNSPLAAMQGQDPILNNLKKFKQDTELSYNEGVKLRVRPQPSKQQTQPSNDPFAAYEVK